MSSLIGHRITAVFVPVENVERARDWYRRVLGFSAGPILHGHLCILATEGTELILDAKPRTPAGEVPVFRAPAFLLPTPDTQAAYDDLRRQRVRILGEIRHGHFFSIADLDGNVLMICGPRE